MAMSSDFLDEFARLPSSQQRSVRTLITRFNADSTASGLNYERIQGARDAKGFGVRYSPRRESPPHTAGLAPAGLFLARFEA